MGNEWTRKINSKRKWQMAKTTCLEWRTLARANYSLIRVFRAYSLIRVNSFLIHVNSRMFRLYFSGLLPRLKTRGLSAGFASTATEEGEDEEFW